MPRKSNDTLKDLNEMIQRNLNKINNIEKECNDSFSSNGTTIAKGEVARLLISKIHARKAYIKHNNPNKNNLI